LLEAPTGVSARGLGTGRTHAFVPIWVQKDFRRLDDLRGRGLLDHPGPPIRAYWFVGWVLERKITDKFMLGVELFHQTPNVIGAMESMGFSR